LHNTQDPSDEGNIEGNISSFDLSVQAHSTLPATAVVSNVPCFGADRPGLVLASVVVVGGNGGFGKFLELILRAGEHADCVPRWRRGRRAVALPRDAPDAR
jgi:hypothetical protein